MKYVSEWIEEQTIVKRGYIFAGEALANSSSTFSWCLPFEQETKVWKEQEKEGEKKDRDKTLIFIQRRRHGASVCARIQQKKIACLGLLGIFSSSFWCLCQAGTSMPAGPADPPLPISHIEKWKEGVVDGRQMRKNEMMRRMEQVVSWCGRWPLHLFFPSPLVRARLPQSHEKRIGWPPSIASLPSNNYSLVLQSPHLAAHLNFPPSLANTHVHYTRVESSRLYVLFSPNTIQCARVCNPTGRQSACSWPYKIKTSASTYLLSKEEGNAHAHNQLLLYTSSSTSSTGRVK